MKDSPTWYVDGKIPARKNGSPEHDIQCALVGLLESIEPTPLYSATVGGVRLAMGTAIKMKQSGYKKGIPDLLIFEPRSMYVGLALEVKTTKGRASEEQKEWARALNSRGWRAEIAHGFEECADIICEYFDLYENLP